MLRPLTKKHGERAVWQAGLLSLGYPPTWAHTFKEVRRVADAIHVQMEVFTNG